MVWRDVCVLDDVDATLAGSTRLAETCLQVALTALEAEFAARHGVVRDRDGRPQRLVFGLGKLGGEELNESDGPRPLSADAYLARLGQQLAKLRDEMTAGGFCHRVDLRLFPYGRVAWSFAAMEQLPARGP